MSSLRTRAIISGGLPAAILILAMLGNELQASGPVQHPEQLAPPAKILFSGLFLVFGFSCVPPVLKLYVAGQYRIGNADPEPVSFLARDTAGITIGASPHGISLTELAPAEADLQAKFVADGWEAGHLEHHTVEDEQLHGGDIDRPAGEYWRKDGLVTRVRRRRIDDAVASKDAAGAGGWIQVIDLREKDAFPGVRFLQVVRPAG